MAASSRAAGQTPGGVKPLAYSVPTVQGLRGRDGEAIPCPGNWASEKDASGLVCTAGEGRAGTCTWLHALEAGGGRACRSTQDARDRRRSRPRCRLAHTSCAARPMPALLLRDSRRKPIIRCLSTLGHFCSLFAPGGGSHIYNLQKGNGLILMKRHLPLN